MRGKPLVQWLVFLLAWGALAYPIARVARHTTEGTVTEAPAPTTSIKTWASLRFSTAPSTFQLLDDGARKGLWAEHGDGSTEFEKALEIDFDQYGCELKLEADVPGTAAAELTLEPDGLEPRSRTVWSSSGRVETVTFSWSRDD